jgi:23S rRNA (cytosine1962-C5)-methyltransferase
MRHFEKSALPTITITRRGADRIRAGHVWVYRSDIVDASSAEPGSVVLVQEQAHSAYQKHAGKGVSSASSARPRQPRPARPGATHTLGSAFYSSASEIAIRMISAKPVSNIEELVRERVRAAIAYRERFVQNTNAYRVVFSEGDFLPGLIVDRYNDLLSLQVLTQAIDAEPVRRAFLAELQDALHPAAIFERVDPRVRKLEQLPEKESGVIASARSANPDSGAAGVSPAQTLKSRPTTTEFHMNGVRFLYDALSGQKTGAFLDQRENYAAAAQYARGEALDVFCYQGGFALHLARTCDKVTGVDSSRAALESAEQNASVNGHEIEWIEANAFDLLRDYSDTGRRYDSIVLDPPAFAKSRQNRETALRGYKELNLRALKMLRPGGILVTCSCSYHVTASDLLDVLASAAQDSHRITRILENRGQSKDHPNVLGVPETAYLKCFISVVS